MGGVHVQKRLDEFKMRAWDIEWVRRVEFTEPRAGHSGDNKVETGPIQEGMRIPKGEHSQIVNRASRIPRNESRNLSGERAQVELTRRPEVGDR
jgi:hypothetical protein